MGAIDNYLTAIGSAVYGEEVRSSIINGIRQCYTDAVDVVKVSTTQPTSENTKIWIKPESDEYKVPTWDEFQTEKTERQYGDGVAFNNTAPTYDETLSYEAGKMVINGGILYLLPNGHAANQTWESTNKEIVNLADQLDQLNGKTEDLKSAINDTGITKIIESPYLTQGYINYDLWQGRTAGTECCGIYPIKPGQSFSVTANAVSTTYIAMLKSFNNPIDGDVPDYSSDSEWSTYVAIRKNNVKSGYAPDDANYLYVHFGRTTTMSRTPASIVVGGYDCIKSAIENIIEMNETILALGEMQETIDSVQDNVENIVSTLDTGNVVPVTNSMRYSNGYISSDGVWDVGVTLTYAVLEVQSGANVKIISNGTLQAGFAALKTYAKPSTGDIPEYSDDPNWDGIKTAGYANKIGTFTGVFPEDAHYLYIFMGNSSFSRMPASIIIDGFDYAKTLFDNFSDIHYDLDRCSVVESTQNSLTNGQMMVACSNIDCEKGEAIYFYANVDASSFGSVTVGHGYNRGHASYITVDGTTVYVGYGTNSDNYHTAHGLTIDKFLTIEIHQGNDFHASVRIVTASGTFDVSNVFWHGNIGDVFALSTNSTLVNPKLTTTFSDFEHDIFLFGDSYVALNNTTRYVTLLVNNGYTKFMVDGYGGRKSEDAIVSFRNVIKMAKPKYLIWALGMNDPDTSSAINTSYKECLDEVVATCKKYGITLILATIPNVPERINTFKNTYVKSLGYRYVDFAAAVGAESQGSSWWPGMLDSDQVHPAALGAQALYARFLIDVPEIANAR